MSFILMAVALVLDTSVPIEEASVKLPRFVNAFVPFFFSGIGVLIQNSVSKKIMNLGLLEVERKRWIRKYIKVKKKNFEKVSKKNRFVFFMMANATANIISLLPWLALFLGLVFVDESAITYLENNKILIKEFFCSAALIKYFSWYATLFISRFTIFWDKKRIRNLA